MYEDLKVLDPYSFKCELEDIDIGLKEDWFEDCKKSLEKIRIGAGVTKLKNYKEIRNLTELIITIFNKYMKACEKIRVGVYQIIKDIFLSTSL